MNGRVVTQEELDQAQGYGDMVPVFKIDTKTVVKTGDCVRLVEAEAMKLVREQTTIPVPEVYNTYVDNETGYVRIVMEFIEGDCLSDVWDNFDTNQRQEVSHQLRDFVDQLQKIKGTIIGSVDGTACYDQLFTDEPGAYGPYQSEEAFNDGIITALNNTTPGGWTNAVAFMVAGVLKGHEIVLTHGDLSPRNILVQGTKVVAILDWEMAGFYPEYWEYVKALYMPAWESDWIRERAVDEIMKPYLAELAVLLHVRTITW